MVTPAHSRLTFSGVTMGTSAAVEIWSFSFKAAALEGNPPGDNAAQVAAANTAKAAYVAHIKPVMPSWTVLKKVRCSIHEPGNLVTRTASGAYLQGDATADEAGTGAQGIRYPLQTALVVSLDTERPGASGKGRSFLPFPAFAIDQEFGLTSGTQFTLATAMANFVKALRPAFGDVRVVSSAGYSSVVTAVRIGRVPDTLRSRRNALLEQYTRVAIPA